MFAPLIAKSFAPSVHRYRNSTSPWRVQIQQRCPGVAGDLRQLTVAVAGDLHVLVAQRRFGELQVVSFAARRAHWGEAIDLENRWKTHGKKWGHA